MTTKNAMVMLLSIGLFSTLSVFGESAQSSISKTTEKNILLSDSNSVEVAERGSGRIEPSATSSAFERHCFS
ncbi:hypothetical protein [[Limnothrix rosea] IAM M-220]|uniref:hypothetical protein n=1 Tax=[Limnothrix rosea] IAM M-220 TaxID=454133 RepID=UPI0011154F39|nr:hypothetical protein [[Limnothrix rosea] IAM M-220]